MTTSRDCLSGALDNAIGEGPPLPPVTDHMVPGRRALRRRRTAVGVGAAAVVAMLGATFAVTGDAGIEAIDDVAVAGTPSPTPHPIRTAAPGQLGDDIAGIDLDNNFLIRSGTEVVTRIWDPLSTPPGSHTDSFAQRANGTVYYYLNYWEDGGDSCGNSSTRSARFPTLESWLAFKATLMDTPDWPWVGQCAAWPTVEPTGVDDELTRCASRGGVHGVRRRPQDAPAPHRVRDLR